MVGLLSQDEWNNSVELGRTPPASLLASPMTPAVNSPRTVDRNNGISRGAGRKLPSGILFLGIVSVIDPIFIRLILAAFSI